MSVSLESISFAKLFLALPLNKDSFANSMPSVWEILFAVAMANPAFARTTSFWAFVPSPLIIFSSYKSYKRLKLENKLIIDQKLSSVVNLKNTSKIRVVFASILVFFYAIFFMAEYEMKDVLISDQKFFSSKLFNNSSVHAKSYSSNSNSLYDFLQICTFEIFLGWVVFLPSITAIVFSVNSNKRLTTAD